MSKIITFNELRRIKDSLPDGSMQEIAKKLDISVDTVRNYFGGTNYKSGGSAGIHMEQGPDGGIVSIEDTTILDMARQMISNKP